jgi:hypothetical protein
MICAIERVHEICYMDRQESAKYILIQTSSKMLNGPRHSSSGRVRARVWSCGICGGQSGAGAGFLRVLRFPLPIFIPPIAPQSPSSIVWGLYNRPEVAAVPSGLSPTPLILKKKDRKADRLPPSSAKA